MAQLARQIKREPPRTTMAWAGRSAEGWCGSESRLPRRASCAWTAISHDSRRTNLEGPTTHFPGDSFAPPLSSHPRLDPRSAV